MVLAHEYREPSKFCHWLILGIKKWQQSSFIIVYPLYQCDHKTKF